MRKITVFTLCLLLIAALALPASAASASLTTSATTVYRNDTFTVAIQVSGTASCTACSIEVTCGSGLTLTGGTCNASGFNMDAKPAEGRFLIYAMSAGNINGTLATLTFRVNSNAALTAQNIGVSMQINGGNVSASTSVTVICNHTYGAWSNAGTSHSRTCTNCGNVDTRAHVYSNSCDKNCNECGAVRTPSAHKFSTNWSSSSEYHWHECAVCGEWADDARHTPGNPATETTAQTCTVCSYVIVPAIGHIHQTDGVWLSDESGHWQSCATCEDKAEFTAHEYSVDCDSTCNVCDYQREVTHTPGEEWLSDGEKHWHVCSVCGEDADIADHEADLTVSDPVCEICGKFVVHTHNFPGEWAGNDERHWHECTCGAEQMGGLHEWDDGIITQKPADGQYGQMVITCTTCGATKTALVVGVGTQQNMLLWWIACGVLAVLLIGTVTVILVFVAKINKKPVGKYAGIK